MLFLNKLFLVTHSAHKLMCARTLRHYDFHRPGCQKRNSMSFKVAVLGKSRYIITIDSGAQRFVYCVYTVQVV